MDALESKKLDVTIQQVQPEEADELTLGDIWQGLKRGWVKLLAWVLVCAIIGGAIGVGYVLLTRKQQVTTIVQFNYDGVEDGKDPKGAVLDVNKIKSPQVVEPALTQLGYGGGGDVNAETVRQAMTIEGLVPQDVIDRLTVVTTIATDASGVNNLEKVLDISYFPTQYKISLDADELKISKQDAQTLLDRVMESYRGYFYETYANVQMMGAAIKGIDYQDYDYTEAMDVLGAQISTMTSYVGGLRARASDFRSVTTGYTFADIVSSLEIIRSTDIALVDSLVYSYNLTKDKSLLTTYLTYQIEENMRQLDVARTTQNTINAKLSAYEKDTVLMMSDAQDSAQKGMSLTLASTEYDGLIEQSIDASTRVAELQAEISKLQSRIEKTEGTGTVSVAEFNQRCAEVEERLASVSEKLTAWIGIVEETAQEYFDTEEFNDAFKVLVPSQTEERGFLMSLVKYGGVGAGGACGIVVLLYIAGVCFGLAAGDRKRKGATASA